MHEKLGKVTNLKEEDGGRKGAVGAALQGAPPPSDCSYSSPSVPPSPPYFLVRNTINVNSQLHRAKGLLAVWELLEYKRRVGMTNIVIIRKDDRKTVRIMPANARSRYFEAGRLHISSAIRKRLGRFERVPGLMETLTYDTKKINKQEAWASYGNDVRQFINGVNQYRKRRGWHRLHYLWVVEVQPGTGYPHVHIFFPNLKWVAPLKIINGNWTKGRANIESPTKITVNCAAYVSKYLRKMRGWSDLHLALLWVGHCRMYGFSSGFSVKAEKKESDWQKWHVIRTTDIAKLEEGLEQGGYKVERLGVVHSG